MNRRSMARLLLVAVLLGAYALLFACAPVRPEGGFATPDAAWNRFQTLQQGAEENRSFLLTASVNYTSPSRSHRVLLTFFGNYDYPLRLDLTAGMGNPIGFWREDSTGWEAYYPGQETAYFHESSRLGSAALGFETPFTLRELALMLGGHYGNFVPQSYAKARTTREGFEYTFAAGSQVKTLTLDPFGRPLVLVGFDTGPGSAPWRVELKELAAPETEQAAGQAAQPDASAQARPMLLDLKRGENESAVVRIKRFASSREERPRETLELRIPPNTRMLRLDEPPKPDLPAR